MLKGMTRYPNRGHPALHVDDEGILNIDECTGIVLIGSSTHVASFGCRRINRGYTSLILLSVDECFLSYDDDNAYSTITKVLILIIILKRNLSCSMMYKTNFIYQFSLTSHKYRWYRMKGVQNKLAENFCYCWVSIHSEENM